MTNILTVEQCRRKSTLQRLRKKFAVPLSLVASILLLVSVDSEANASECKLVHSLSDKQLGILVKSYHAGVDDGFGYSLAAIAWKESLAGVIKINAFDPSFGIYHISLTTAASREGVSGNFRKNMLAQRLIDDDDYAAYHAIQELKGWSVRHNGDWRLMWASYNGGNSWHKAKPQAYAKEIAERVRMIQKCLIPLTTQTANKQA
jgi:hypothetical protein